MRLKKIISLVKNSKVTLDVGTDHGYVPICLVNEKRAEKVIAADVNKGPLDNAERNIRLNGLSDKIELRLGGGLTPVRKGEADTVVIAGMGGILISDILEESYEKAVCMNKLILQPMNSQEILRKYLVKRGFMIVKEHLAREGEKVYNIIEAQPGQDIVYDKESFYILGHYSKFDKSDIYDYYIEKYKKQSETVLKNLSASANDLEAEKRRFSELLKDMEDYYA